MKVLRGDEDVWVLFLMLLLVVVQIVVLGHSIGCWIGALFFFVFLG